MENLHQFSFGTFDGCEITFSRRWQVYGGIVGYVTLYFTTSLFWGSYGDEITSCRGLYKYFRFDVRALRFRIVPLRERDRERERERETKREEGRERERVRERSPAYSKTPSNFKAMNDKVSSTENALGGFHYVVIWVTSPTLRIIPVGTR